MEQQVWVRHWPAFSITVAVARGPHGAYVGVARAGPRDHWCRRLGAAIATGRALKADRAIQHRYHLTAIDGLFWADPRGDRLDWSELVRRLLSVHYSEAAHYRDRLLHALRTATRGMVSDTHRVGDA